MPAATPTQPTSRLEKAIVRARAALQAGTTFTTSVSLDPAVAVAALLLADKERRDFSNLIDVALSEYVGETPCLSPELNTLIAKLTAAVQENPALQKELDELLRSSKRATRTRVSA